jgi:RNA polymerase, sigma 54 subunit, RpoN/SigL
MSGITILNRYFNEFTKKHFEKIQRGLGLDEQRLKRINKIILKLNPKPSVGYVTTTREVQYIVPDFIINNNAGELELTLNSRNAPDLRVNDYYREMLKAYSTGKRGKKEKEAAVFIKSKIDAAKWFIDAIKQRQHTMFNTMLAIMQYQREYFLTGDEKRLRPMILKDIAEVTNLDISTVSRVANSKYVQTEFGCKPLKAFFSEALQMDSGEEVSTLEVKNILQEFINNENPKRPLSDEKLMSMLLERGYNIARRTVAKYRDSLGIPGCTSA